MEKRAEAAADRFESLLFQLENQPLRRSLRSNDVEAPIASAFRPHALPPLSRLESLTLTGSAHRTVPDPVDEPPAKPTVDLIRAPSVLPDIAAAAKRDQDNAHSYGGKPATYGVWHSGPVPPSWAPPVDPPRPPPAAKPATSGEGA